MPSEMMIILPPESLSGASLLALQLSGARGEVSIQKFTGNSNCNQSKDPAEHT
jgi:hypothetical protein